MAWKGRYGDTAVADVQAYRDRDTEGMEGVNPSIGEPPGGSSGEKAVKQARLGSP